MKTSKPRGAAINFVFTDVAAAEALAAEQTKINPRKRAVYTASTEGQPEVYVVAQSLGRARNHAAKHYQLRVTRYGVATRVRAPSDPVAAKIDTMSDEQLAAVESLIAAVRVKNGLAPIAG